MKQSDAVYKATEQVFTEHGVDFHDGIKAQDFCTAEMRKQIIEIVTAGIESGDVDFSDSAHAKHDTTDKKRGYVRGMVSNWFRRDQRLNGGEVYQPKNPGSRVGSSDDQVKALRALLKSGTLDADGVKMAEKALNDRLAEIRAERNKVEIDIDALPANIQALINN